MRTFTRFKAAERRLRRYSASEGGLRGADRAAVFVLDLVHEREPRVVALLAPAARVVALEVAAPALAVARIHVVLHLLGLLGGDYLHAVHEQSERKRGFGCPVRIPDHPQEALNARTPCDVCPPARLPICFASFYIGIIPYSEPQVGNRRKKSPHKLQKFSAQARADSQSRAICARSESRPSNLRSGRIKRRKET